MILIFKWLLTALDDLYDPVQLLKETPRGTVRLIRHKASKRPFILRQFEGNSEVYHQLMQFTCRNLPQIYEVSELDGQVIVLEEYIQGDTIDFLLQDSLFTPRETRKIIRQICQALLVLHSIAAVHRDIKPDNVILRGDQAVLIDFDAARVYKPDQESDTQVLGTIGYAAPEQYGLSQSDTRADIYSLGILMNIMLTGEHPSRKLAEGKLGRIVEHCTQVNPNKRYRNVLWLMEVL